MTLSRFLRDYLYIPLGGNRHGAGAPLRQSHGDDAARRPVARRRLDLRRCGAACMALYLVVNHAWNHFSNHRSLGVFGWLLTFFAVANTWVLFRAADMTTALHLYKSMYSTSS